MDEAEITRHGFIEARRQPLGEFLSLLKQRSMRLRKA